MVMPPEVQLLETMRVSEGEIVLLKRHMERIWRSSQELGFVCDTDVVGAAIWTAGVRQTESVVLRFLLSRDGSHEIQVKALPPAGWPGYLQLSSVVVDSDDPTLRHKTTARAVYERAREGCRDEADALIVNERGEITETSILNVAVKRDGLWITPPVACGLLPGTMRAELLDEGSIREGVILAHDLVPGEMIRCFNAVRGVLDVPFRPSAGMSS
jgi:branched-subunit amino acid aminotransferase/4-amino-4-deoxychorismate lyase